MGRRADTDSLVFAVLLRANRVTVTGVLAVVIFGAFVLAVSSLRPSIVQQLQSSTVIEILFTTMISVVVTGTTLVVSIGQLVLTQETGPLGDQRSRMSSSMNFRDYVQELTGEPSPTDPSGLLNTLIEETIARSRAVRDGIDGPAMNDVEREIMTFTETVIGNGELVSGRLRDAQFGAFDVMSPALEFNYGWKIAWIERVESDHADELDEADLQRLDALRTSLSMFGPAREHVKTLYFQYELIVLSRRILYAAVLAIVVAGIMTVIVEPATVPGTVYGVEYITIVVGAAFTITVLPFLLFVSYILRILTVAKRTLAIEPLTLHE